MKAENVNYVFAKEKIKNVKKNVETDLYELETFLGLLHFGGVEKNNHRNTRELFLFVIYIYCL